MIYTLMLETSAYTSLDTYKFKLFYTSLNQFYILYCIIFERKVTVCYAEDGKASDKNNNNTSCFITYYYYCIFVYCKYASYIYCVLCILYDVHYCCLVPLCRMVSIPPPPPSISQWKAAGSNVKFPRCGEYSATLESTSHSAFQAFLRHCSSVPPPSQRQRILYVASMPYAAVTVFL
jgi:hypothetical protein